MALFLNPLDALHGDLGVVASEDVCLLLSNGGETAELLEVLPHLKRRAPAESPSSVGLSPPWPAAAMWCWLRGWIGRSAR